MSSLGKEEIHALGKVAGLEICEPELTEVCYNLNAILKVMDDVDIPDLNDPGTFANHYPAGS